MMMPEFALTLSFDGITLLRRVSGGWTPVGDVALDAADLRGALAELRSEADALSPAGGEVQLVLPNEQIKYLTLPDTGLTGDILQNEIKDALNGATPYSVDELRYDWVTSNGTIYIAAVANETLDEAEAFAKSHHFTPVSFVANAPDGQYEGAAFFGKATTWTGDTPVKDSAPFNILTAPVEDTPPTENVVVEEAAVDVSFADLVEDTSAALDDLEAARAPTDTAVQDEADALTPNAAAEPEVAVPVEAVTPAPSFASIRASRKAPDPVSSAPAEHPAPPPETPQPVVAPLASEAEAPKPRFKLGGVHKSTGSGEVIAASITAETAEDAPERKGLGFFSRRKPAEPTPAPRVSEPKPTPPLAAPVAKVPPPRAPQAPRHNSGPAREAVAKIAAMRAGRDPELALPAAGGTAAIPNERDRMTIFGARTEPQIGGKPRFLGLMLTSALLIFLLAVAAWASVFLDEGISRFFDRSNKTPSLALPDVELEPLDGTITAPPEDTNVQLASLDTSDAAVQTDNALSDVLPPPAALTPEEAEARYAATGIWQRSPQMPDQPDVTHLDGLYIASIDRKVEQFDAVALPTTEALRKDQPYFAQPNPPVPGSRYDLDENGLVIATPEGALNPEGVRIFAGLPPVVPPARPQAPDVLPDVAPQVETDGQTATDVITEDVSPLRNFRPRVRPEGLVEVTERVQLSGWTRAELAAFRPKTRPQTQKAIEEEAQPEATEFAVVQSVEPVTRPRNFARIVEDTRTRQEAAPEEPTRVAAVAPRTVQPRIPSTANVARQATVTNAINLRRINLIGVYGKPSSRRALVRLSNGRYQKVEVGDRLDGGRVAAIGTSELRYTKNGRNVVLDMPDG